MSSLENILSSPMWSAGVAIGTIFLAFVTYLTLQELRRDKKVRVNRKIKDKIYEVYLEDLRHIQDSVVVLTLGPTPLPDFASKFISPPLPFGVQADVPGFIHGKLSKKNIHFLQKKQK